MAIRAHALLATGDLDAADQAAAEAVSRGVAAPEPGATVFGGVARSVVARARGQLDQAIAYAQEAVQTADELGGAARHRHPRLWLGRALSGADRFEEAERVYAAGQQEADLLATRGPQPLCTTTAPRWWPPAGTWPTRRRGPRPGCGWPNSSPPGR